MTQLFKKYSLPHTPTKSTVVVLSATIFYLVVTAMLIGLRTEHWFIAGLYNICFFVNVRSRKFILAFSIFIIYGIIYDLMKAFPNYLVHHVDIQHIYSFEKKVFGLIVHHNKITFNEFWNLHHTRFLDILAGIFYINWVPVPLVFAMYLYVKNKQQFLRFSLAFFLVNIIGFCIYYIHPAAPPWYINEYGTNLNLHAHGSTAGLSRFDQIIRFPLFASIYSKNSNVFAALPSLHCAYPVIVLFYAVKNRLGKINWLLGLFMAGIWFSAVYSGHHYVTDVIAGILCAIVTIAIFHRLLLSRTGFKDFLKKYEDVIS